MAVLPAQVGVVGGQAAVDVLQQIHRVLGSAGAQVDPQHGPDVHPLAPLQKLVGAHLVGLQGKPGQLRPHRTLVLGADAVLPAVAGQEVAPGIADVGQAQGANQLRHIPAEARLVGGGVVGLVDAGVHRPAHVLNKGAVEPVVHPGEISF